MKILFLGPITPGQTSLMRMNALSRLGHEVFGVDTSAPWRNVGWAARQVFRRTGRGPPVNQLNQHVLRAARESSPDIVWAEKQEFLTEETVQALRAGGARVVHFTPDPYFWLNWRRTGRMDQALPSYDVLVYCKRYEHDAYSALDLPLVYMPLGYCDEVHRPLRSSGPEWNCDIGFLGGWEPRREEHIRQLLVGGLDVKIWGGYWDFLVDGQWSLRRQIILAQLAGEGPFRIRRDALIAGAWRGGEVYADDYARALSGAKIGLGFLRTTWPDQHTTRSFEIPACGSMLLADRTDEHAELFREGAEAEFFSTPDELADKAAYYVRHDEERARIARAGYDRCIKSQYAYIHRLAAALKAIGDLT